MANGAKKAAKNLRNKKENPDSWKEWTGARPEGVEGAGGLASKSESAERVAKARKAIKDNPVSKTPLRDSIKTGLSAKFLGGAKRVVEGVQKGAKRVVEGVQKATDLHGPVSPINDRIGKKRKEYVGGEFRDKKEGEVTLEKPPADRNKKALKKGGAEGVEEATDEYAMNAERLTKPVPRKDAMKAERLMRELPYRKFEPRAKEKEVTLEKPPADKNKKKRKTRRRR